MEAIEQIFNSYLQTKFGDTLQNLTQPATWTKENRDQTLQDLNDLFKVIADEGLTFIKELEETQIDGKSVIYWSLLVPMKAQLLNLLRAARDELDQTPPEEIPNVPVDYEWLNPKIRELTSEILQIQTNVERFVDTANPGVEQL